MKAWRNIAGVVQEIQIDVGIDGNPIYPPDTTTDARPEALPGHYVTVVDRSWVQIESPVYVESFEAKKARLLKVVSTYRSWYLDQPVPVNDVLFDADDQARTRLTQAVVMYTNLNYLPPAWIAKDNSIYPLASFEDLKAIVGTVQTAFSTRFYECDTVRQQLLAAATEEELSAVTVPSVPMNHGF